MRRRWSALALNQRLAVMALALGLGALFAQPFGGNVVALDVNEVALLVANEGDHVTATDLAGWIVAGRADYLLIDLRSEQEFAAYHIPTAENVTLAALPDAPVPRDERIVLYSEGGLHGAQAWMLMRAKGYRGVYSLKGGLDQWKDEVLFPSLAADASEQDRARFERAASVAKFFGGAPRSGTSATDLADLPALPKVAPPVAPSGAGPVAPRKKKEGC